MADKITTLHPKDDKNTNVYPNVKSENIIDKDTISFTEGCVPDSKLVQKNLDSLAEHIEGQIEAVKVSVNKNTKSIEAETTARTTADEEIKKSVSSLNTALETEEKERKNAVSNLSSALNAQSETIETHTAQISSIQEDLSTLDNSLLKTNDRVNSLENDTVDLTTDQEVNGVKTFKSPIKTNEIDNESGNALLRYKETEAKNVVGGVNYDLTLMGKSDRPKYSKDGSDFEGEELALYSDISTLIDEKVGTLIEGEY